MAKERWRRARSGLMALFYAVERTFLASRLALIQEDKQHWQDLTIDVENAEGYRIGHVSMQAIQADRENADSLVRVNAAVLMHVRAFCSDWQD
jgi:hypothetical protein